MANYLIDGERSGNALAYAIHPKIDTLFIHSLTNRGSREAFIYGMP